MRIGDVPLGTCWRCLFGKDLGILVKRYRVVYTEDSDTRDFEETAILGEIEVKFVPVELV